MRNKGWLWLLLALVVAGAMTLMPDPHRYDPLFVQALQGARGELVDAPATDFELRGLDGQVHRLSDFEGQMVMVNFWASWCAPCRREIPSMRQLAGQMRGRPFVMLALTQDETPEDARAFLMEVGVSPDEMLVLHDPEGAVARAWGTQLLPETFFVDPEGQVALRIQNERDWTDASVLQLIERVIHSAWRR